LSFDPGATFCTAITYNPADPPPPIDPPPPKVSPLSW